MLVNEIVIVFLCIFASFGLFAIVGFALYLLNTWYSTDITDLKKYNNDLTKTNRELQKDIIKLVRENRTLKEQQKNEI